MTGAEKSKHDVEWLLLRLDCVQQVDGDTLGRKGPNSGPATGSKIMPRVLPSKKALQALALILATAYATILLYQAVVPRQVMSFSNSNLCSELFDSFSANLLTIDIN